MLTALPCVKKDGNFSVWIFRRALIYDRPAFQIRPIDVMNLDRGFRRLVLSISLAGVAVGLVVTGYDTCQTIRYVSQHKEVGRCVNNALARRATVEDFKRLPDWMKPRVSPGEKVDEVEGLKRWNDSV